MGLNVGSSGAAPSWLKVGAASVAVAKQAEVEAEQRKAEQGKMFRFWIKEGEEARITFVDGDLQDTPQGKFLLPPRYYEHSLMLNGKWGNNYVCPQMSDPDGGHKCPICESGDRPSLVALFTVIDHRTVTGKNDKVYKDVPRLFVAKPGTFEQLNKLAQKTGGLAGTTWDVSRVGDKAASVGNQFFPQGKTDLEELKAKYMQTMKDPKTGVETKTTIFVPANYQSEIVFRTGDELRAMGLGKPGSTPSGFSQPTGGTATNYETQL